MNRPLSLVIVPLAIAAVVASPTGAIYATGHSEIVLAMGSTQAATEAAVDATEATAGARQLIAWDGTRATSGSIVVVPPRMIAFEGLHHPTIVDVDECQGCDMWVQYNDIFDEYWGYWEHYYSDGSCPGSAPNCVRCVAEWPPFHCPEDGNVNGPFDDEEDAWNANYSETNCGDCAESDGEPLMMVVALTEKHAAHDLAELLATSGGKIWLNEQRTAVQAIGCGSQVGLHLPIGTGLFAAVSAELNAIRHRERGIED